MVHTAHSAQLPMGYLDTEGRPGGCGVMDILGQSNAGSGLQGSGSGSRDKENILTSNNQFGN